ncbi:PEP-CTERM sorting domain-containing protein [Tychonema sp. LEGE 07199]|uniref:PEP-CTERM sorting domain-containing protein n=1 Tax=unclassified Tychonema TaxID=2642144 RepID=UPI001881C07F|nr:MULTISPECIES: PEP-CTERM sorting domain-containing protein [unclassified Tychonema]MBE9119563.1 PEP-CTERM sorting domain-containing protein [Tychonema sp. LEGE 07199]MBE9131767.1 PEP-CTERM sorting domain-containing protein [Tychonema sp. LEGE 07196]
MNTKILSALTATAAVTAMLGAAAPAHAFSFGTNGISFTEDTNVTFNFLESHGAYTSSLGIYEVNKSVASLVSTLFSETKSSDNGDSNEWRGTSGNTVASGPVTFQFLANKVYTLGLSSLYNGASAGTVYSTSSLNGGSQQAVFGGQSLLGALDKDTTNVFKAAKNYKNGASSLLNGATIGFDDAGNGNDKDFQDFTVSATVPEPMTMTGLALGLGGLIAARRRRASKAAS